jgi:Fe2+ or Zn2+ uptake regulation protein
MNQLELILNALRSQNYRITKPRMAILNVLQKSALTLKEVHELVKLEGHHNLATVYNTLDFLEETGLVHIQIKDGEKTYSYSDQNFPKALIQMQCEDRNQSIQLKNHHLIDDIRHHPLFEGFDIEELEIRIKGHCDQTQKDACAETGVCMIDKVSADLS